MSQAKNLIKTAFHFNSFQLLALKLAELGSAQLKLVAYIFWSYHALPLNIDFWVDLRVQMIAPPPLVVNSNKTEPR